MSDHPNVRTTMPVKKRQESLLLQLKSAKYQSSATHINTPQRR